MTLPQAQVALKKYKDVMEAAEGIFGGEFDHITGMDEDVQMAGPSTVTSEVKPPVKMTVWFHPYLS